MTGNITRRGKNSWRLKFEAASRDATGKRTTRFVTVRGTKKQAQAELIRLLAEVENGTAVDPSKVTVGDYVRSWLDGASHLAPKTAERYRELAEKQIVPHLGDVLLQKLRPARIAEWHSDLLRGGGRAATLAAYCGTRTPRAALSSGPGSKARARITQRRFSAVAACSSPAGN